MREFNEDERIHGILVQLPLPSHIDETAVLDAISFEKDVDGFHPMNIGLMALKNRSPLFVSCTPKVSPKAFCRKRIEQLSCAYTLQACMELLKRYDVEIAGKRAVVIGRSNIVGMPMGLLLQQKDATVTTVHSRYVISVR